MPSGIVEKIEGEYAIVKLERQDMCGDCHACDSVHAAQSCTLKCFNDLHTQVGDAVEISVDNSTFLKAAVIMYGLPFIGLVGGIIGGYILSTFIPTVNGELFMILGALLGMLFMFFIVKNRDKKNKYKKMLPHIIGIKK